jgi:hypothetical protein
MPGNRQGETDVSEGPDDNEGEEDDEDSSIALASMIAAWRQRRAEGEGGEDEDSGEAKHSLALRSGATPADEVVLVSAARPRRALTSVPDRRT